MNLDTKCAILLTARFIILNIYFCSSSYHLSHEIKCDLWPTYTLLVSFYLGSLKNRKYIIYF